MRGFNYKKSVQSLNLFAIREGGATFNKMKAIKLIWLSDRLHLRTHGRTVTGDQYFALPHGPVPSTTKDILGENSFSLSDDELKYANEYISIIDQYNYKSVADSDLRVFSKTERDILNSVYDKYGHYDQFQLRNISHEFPEWKKYESALNKKISSRFEMQLSDFFTEAPKQFDYFLIDPEVVSISKEIFTENEVVENYFR